MWSALFGFLDPFAEEARTPETQALQLASSATSETKKKYGAGIYNDTLRAAPFYAQLPVACNLTGRGGWVLLFFETLDGGENALPVPQPAGGCSGTEGNKVCGCHADGGLVTLTCPDHSSTIVGVSFAALGTPTGTCGNLSTGTCTGDPTLAKAYVAKQCVGKSSCALDADIKTFNSGKDPCFGVAKSVAVEVTCSGAVPPPQPAPPPSPLQPAAPEQWQVDALKAAIACGLKVIIRIGQHNRNYRYFADDKSFRSYTRLAKRYTQFTASLLRQASVVDPSSIVVIPNNGDFLLIFTVFRLFFD